MTGWSWLLYLLLVLALAAFTAWLYLRREPPGAGRAVLTALRVLVLAIVLLLLFDPGLPARHREPGLRTQRILLDASASMSLPVRPGAAETRWQAALRQARRRPGDVLLFGDRVRPLAADSLPARVPGDARSQVLPALRAAAEAGAESVTVITDGALEGTGGLPAWLARLGLGVQWRAVGEPLGGLSIPELSAPGWAVAGNVVDLQLTVAAAAPAPDSARVLVRQDGRTLADTSIVAPPPGRSASIQLPVRPLASADGGYVRLEISLQPGDALPDDDRRLISLYVSAEPAGIALVSLQPDEEPRFLLPVLARALGMPATGYLLAGTGWVRVSSGQRAGEPVPEDAVRRTVARAELLVLQGNAETAPDWLEPLLAAGPPLLLLPGGAAGSLPGSMTIGASIQADWFLKPGVPASPVAAMLADVAISDLPPLPALSPASPPPGAWAPLLVTRGRGGEARPLLLAGEVRGRRWAAGLGQGYWRWAFPGGAGRALYDRFWSAVGGWLVGGRGTEAAGVRPVSRVIPRGEASRWIVPGPAPDSLRLQLSDVAGRAALDTVLRNPAGDTLQAPVLPPGVYRYQAQAFVGARRLAGAGELAVETWSPELARPPVNLSALAAADRVGPGIAGRRGRRPLHTSPVPYVLLVVLLSAEWVLRRRWGLR